MNPLQRRKRVMSRSMKLGHCVCDAKQACPCDLFKQKNICMCAGERAELPPHEVRLTTLVQKAGCASKIDQAFLKSVLSGLSMPQDPRVLVGIPAGDDAGIYELDNGTCLVQTVDVFTPIVDDPYTFGQVAAANSVSDIYAMGGRPLTALSIIGFPVGELPDVAMREILRGGIDKMNEAGVAIIGGHSINEREIKAGFAVTGIITKDKVLTNAALRLGDALILTKPLGTGILSFAWQIGRTSQANMQKAANSMAQLNKKAAELMTEMGAHAATDVTGFGLMGHLSEMALRSGVNVDLVWDALPWLDGVLQCAAEGILPGAIERNRQSYGHAVTLGTNVTELMADVCFDAQTSGGLLIAIENSKADALLRRLHEAGIHDAACIGHVTEKGSGAITIVTNGTRKFDVQDSRPAASEIKSPAGTEKAKPCCPEHSTMAGQTAEGSYLSFLAEVNRPGGLDAVTKQAINIALSAATRCEPCLKAHIEKARAKGFSQAEIDEAAWMGIAFGGSPAMMLYKGIKSEIPS
ncbi:MAG: selenide, water dikinase SelD [Planctomycetaceae bacterium]|nr:selenide, water dikinase SelD [Planctomycetaceae bacterium]